LIDIDGDFLSLMDDMGETRDDIKIPEGELGDEIKERFGNDEGLLISVLSAMDEECAVAVKNQAK